MTEYLSFDLLIGAIVVMRKIMECSGVMLIRRLIAEEVQRSVRMDECDECC
jgi:hypothetical protein